MRATKFLYHGPPMKKVTRKLFICVGCEGVYADATVSQCDCLQDPPQFIETKCTYYVHIPKPDSSQEAPTPAT